MGGMSYSQQPAAVYPGPPMPQPQTGMPGSVAPGYGQPPATGAAPGGMFPQQTPHMIQPTPDPAMNGAAPVQQMGAIQQVGYEEPQSGGSGMLGWLPGRRNPPAPPQATNPAFRRTNATSPSLESGIDGRLNGYGRTGQRRPAARRGLYQ